MLTGYACRYFKDKGIILHTWHATIQRKFPTHAVMWKQLSAMLQLAKLLIGFLATWYLEMCWFPLPSRVASMGAILQGNECWLGNSGS